LTGQQPVAISYPINASGNVGTGSDITFVSEYGPQTPGPTGWNDWKLQLGVYEPQPTPQIEIDAAKLQQQLEKMCPDETKKTAWGTICCPSDCKKEAEIIANAIKDKIKAESKDILTGGKEGNIIALLSCEKYGHGCTNWQRIVLEGFQEGSKKLSPKGNCFNAAAVATDYPFTRWTKHNWVEILGPNIKTYPQIDFVHSPRISIDPWPSGGSSLFSSTSRTIDEITKQVYY